MNEEQSWGREYKGHWKIILVPLKEINIEWSLFAFWNSGRKGRHRTCFRWLWKELIAKLSSDHNTLHVVMTDLGPDWARIQRQLMKSLKLIVRNGYLEKLVTDIELLTTGTDTVYPQGYCDARSKTSVSRSVAKQYESRHRGCGLFRDHNLLMY